MRATLALTVAVSALAIAAPAAHTRDNIQVAGSSTVLPFTSIVVEEFSAIFSEFPPRRWLGRHQWRHAPVLRRRGH